MNFPTIERLLKKSSEETVTHICSEHTDCKNAEHCLSTIEVTNFEDCGSNIRRYIKGLGDCEYEQ